MRETKYHMKERIEPITRTVTPASSNAVPISSAVCLLSIACLQKEVGDSVKAAMASLLRALPHRNMDARFHLANIPLRLVPNTTKFPCAVLRPVQCPGDPVPARWL